MAVSDYSKTPASNTSISGLDIDEACDPANVNNAIRQIMADVRTDIGWRIISTATVATVASVDLTDLSADYRAYKIVFDRLLADTSASHLYLRFSTDNGATFLSGATDYEYVRMITTSVSSSVSVGGSAGDSKLYLIPNIGATSSNRVSGEILISNPNSSLSLPAAQADAIYRNADGNFTIVKSGGQYTTNAAANAVRLLMSAGNILQMRYTLFGLVAT